MPFRFRRSKKVGPFRFTMSGSGLSASVGSGPFRYTFNSNGGRTRTVRTGIPGLRYEERDTPNQVRKKKARKLEHDDSAQAEFNEISRQYRD
ncbi:DUF4236 domain-containing protein [Corynebacterium sp. HMSC071B10]|uniref:DUF4236 domain-containing protein n=1 Tax=Corynebacterium sp. HMSC071B10 TaxID=1739494 RepID=UPI0008A42333|nr:DUF4236 domain-containing protein [Corynebacterium sp. HMSC071B10]OFP34721.1 hypothetical protein HMPREF2990_09625 [Corynebacterium sp. HMSC071B10]